MSEDTFAEAGFVYDIGGENQSWRGQTPIEIRESTGGTGWEWRRLTDEERSYIIDCLNSRASSVNARGHGVIPISDVVRGPPSPNASAFGNSPREIQKRALLMRTAKIEDAAQQDVREADRLRGAIQDCADGGPCAKYTLNEHKDR